MRKVLMIVLLMIFYVQLQNFQDDHLIHRLTHERLKNSINRGAHDASLQVDPVAWGEGRIEFVTDRALLAFKNTMSANIGLDPVTLKPLPNTMLTSEMDILFEDYIDFKDNVKFPYLYKNSTYGIQRTIYGPAVVYVVRIKTPKYSATSSNAYIQKPVVFEYPFP